jgi:hypothetical protein
MGKVDGWFQRGFVWEQNLPLVGAASRGEGVWQGLW